jgi:hypothetical protein
VSGHADEAVAERARAERRQVSGRQELGSTRRTKSMPTAGSAESFATARQIAKSSAVLTRFLSPSCSVIGRRAWLKTAAGVSPTPFSANQNAFDVLHFLTALPKRTSQTRRA